MYKKIVYGIVAAVVCLALVYFGVKHKEVKKPVASPPAHVDAPVYAEVGELVRLKVVDGVGSTFSWQPLEDGSDFAIFNSGREAVFSAREKGIYKFILAVSTDGKAGVLIHTVNVGVYPEKVPEWVVAQCNRLQPDKEKVKKLGEAFKVVAEKVDSGVLTEVKDILKASSEANKLVINGDVKLVAFMGELQKLLKSKADKGELETPADHAKLWMEISQGLTTWASK